RELITSKLRILFKPLLQKGIIMQSFKKSLPYPLVYHLSSNPLFSQNMKIQLLWDSPNKQGLPIIPTILIQTQLLSIQSKRSVQFFFFKQKTAYEMAVKRLKDAVDVAGKKEFEQQMEVLGRLRHSNLVSLKAYYFAREEKLLVS